MPDAQEPLHIRIRRIIHAFSDDARRDAVRALAAEVEALEQARDEALAIGSEGQAIHQLNDVRDQLAKAKATIAELSEPWTLEQDDTVAPGPSSVLPDKWRIVTRGEMERHRVHDIVGRHGYIATVMGHAVARRIVNLHHNTLRAEAEEKAAVEREKMLDVIRLAFQMRASDWVDSDTAREMEEALEPFAHLDPYSDDAVLIVAECPECGGQLVDHPDGVTTCADCMWRPDMDEDSDEDSDEG